MNGRRWWWQRIFSLPCFVIIVFSQQGAFAEGLVLTPQKVVDRILADGFDKKELDLDRVVDSKAYYDAKGYFDFGFESELNYQQVNLEPLGPFENEKEDTYSFRSKLQKPIGWGSTISLEYSRDSLQRQLNPFLASNNSLSTLTTDFVHLELQQNLLNNFGGGVYDRRLKMQELMESQRNEKLIEDTETLIVDGLSQYWTTYIASQNLKAAIDTRDRYIKLVSTSKRKKRLGFAAPGELARVEAEYELKNQNVKQLSTNYLAELDHLFLLLGVETPESVEFDVGGEEIPALPNLKPVDVESVREYKIQQLVTRSWEMQKKIVESSQTPVLDLTARLSYRGADEQSSEAFSDLTGLNSPTYFVGLKFQTYLGSSSQYGAKAEARAQYQKQQILLKKTKMQLSDLIDKTKRNVSAYYQIAQSAKSTVELRQKALREIESAYAQGRLDVSHVIESFNFLLNAKIQMTTSIAQYHHSRNLWASFRDELITNYTQSEPGDQQ